MFEAEVQTIFHGWKIASWAHVGDELKRVPKATKWGNGQRSTDGTLIAGREATGIPRVSRHRLMKLSGVKREGQVAPSCFDSGGIG